MYGGARLSPHGAFGKGILAMAIMGRAIAESKTHRITSALSQSHRTRFSASGLYKRGGPESEVYIVPIRNPISGIPTTFYAGIEDARGGDHAFYNTVVEDYDNLLFEAFAGPFARAMGM